MEDKTISLSSTSVSVGINFSVLHSKYSLKDDKPSWGFLDNDGKLYQYRRATRNFSGQGGFVKLGHFNKHFIKKSRKKAPQGKILEFFLLDTLKATF